MEPYNDIPAEFFNSYNTNATTGPDVAGPVLDVAMKSARRPAAGEPRPVALPMTAGPLTGPCALLELSDDELEAVGKQISNALHPAVASALAACCKNLWRVMWPLFAELQARHAAAQALSAKIGSCCAWMRETNVLCCHHKDLTTIDMATLSMLFSSSALARVKTFDLSFNNLGRTSEPARVEALLSGLKPGDAPRLRDLNLHLSDFCDQGAAFLADTLDRCALPNLEKLSVGSNTLTDKGLVALARPLRQRPALKRLQLHDNYIGDAGVAALVDNLGAQELKKLEVLNLAHNKITDVGCASIAAALNSDGLPELGLCLYGDTPTSAGGNPASAAAQKAVSDALNATIGKRIRQCLIRRGHSCA